MGWLISDIQEVLSSYENSFQVNFAPRSCNKAARHLAKLALCNSEGGWNFLSSHIFVACE